MLGYGLALLASLHVLTEHLPIQFSKVHGLPFFHNKVLPIQVLLTQKVARKHQHLSMPPFSTPPSPHHGEVWQSSAIQFFFNFNSFFFLIARSPYPHPFVLCYKRFEFGGHVPLGPYNCVRSRGRRGSELGPSCMPHALRMPTSMKGTTYRTRPLLLSL